MRVADVMETRVDVAEAGTGADEAWAHMQQHDLHSLIVTDAGRIVGILGRARLAGPGGSPPWQRSHAGRVAAARAHHHPRRVPGLPCGRSARGRRVGLRGGARSRPARGGADPVGPPPPPRDARGTRAGIVTNTPAVAFEHVALAFDDVVVLRDVSFTIAEGHMAILMGPSGCGKSLVLKLMLGLIRPDSGVIRINGERIDDLPESRMMAVRDTIGMLFQEGALFDSLTVEQNVGFKLTEEGRLPAQGHSSARGGDAGRDRPDRVHRSQPRRALGRSAPARGGGPRHGGAPAHPPARRPDVGPRPDHGQDRRRQHPRTA